MDGGCLSLVLPFAKVTAQMNLFDSEDLGTAEVCNVKYLPAYLVQNCCLVMY